jgi:hypothetical protein
LAGLFCQPAEVHRRGDELAGPGAPLKDDFREGGY